MILEKLLGLMAGNPRLIGLKQQHPDIYDGLKREMVDILVRNE